MHFAIADRDVAGPDMPVVPRGRITTGRIVCLHAIERLFGFINTIAVNSVATRIQFLARGVSIVWIRKDVEAVDYYALCEMKTNVIDDHAVFGFSADRQRVPRIEVIDA